MTSTDQLHPDLDPQSEVTTPLRLVAGATCCLSGIALVIHILTGSPLWLVLTGLGFAFSLAVVIASAGNQTALTQVMSLVKTGVVVGAGGTAAYDASRWVLTQLGGLELSPFDALPLFGQALLGESTDSTLVLVAGVAYHVTNGVAFGIAYVIWFGHRSWWWGVVFAFGLEVAMLAIYPGWLDPASIGELTQVSLVGHVAYGATMGMLARWAMPRRRLPTQPVDTVFAGATAPETEGRNG